MPTQEERLSAVEKFQTLAAAHIRETEENTTILLGVIREYGRDIKRTFQRLEIIDERLETMDGRLDTLEDRFGAIDGRLGVVESRLETLEGRFEALENRFEALENHFGALENRFGTLENGFASQEKKLDQILHLLTTQSTRPIQETE